MDNVVDQKVHGVIDVRGVCDRVAGGEPDHSSEDSI